MLATQKKMQLSKVQGHDSGCECFFIKYGDVGIKLYDDEDHATRVADRQRKASEHGLGPDILGDVAAYCMPEDLIELAPLNMRKPVLYGYETEIVEVRSDTPWAAIKSLRLEMEDVWGCKIFDCGCRNAGWKSGKLVCIDFGDCSFEELS